MFFEVRSFELLNSVMLVFFTHLLNPNSNNDPYFKHSIRDDVASQELWSYFKGLPAWYWEHGTRLGGIGKPLLKTFLILIFCIFFSNLLLLANRSNTISFIVIGPYDSWEGVRKLIFIYIVTWNHKKEENYLVNMSWKQP